MDVLYFSNYKEFVKNAKNTYEKLNNKEDNIDIIAKYNDAKEIIKELILTGYSINTIVGLEDVDFGSYYDEYVIGLFKDEIWCEPVIRDNEYIGCQSNVCYLFGDCNSKYINYIDSKKIYIVDFCDNDKSVREENEHVNENTDSHCSYNSCDCNKKYDCKDDFKMDNKSVFFVPSEATYEVNGKTVSKEEYEKVLDRIDEKYVDGMQSMLLKYCGVRDEINELRSMLKFGI